MPEGSHLESTWTEHLSHQQAAESIFISVVFNTNVFSSLSLEERASETHVWIASQPGGVPQHV